MAVWKVLLVLLAVVVCACAQDWLSVRVIQASGGLASDSVKVENAGNFSVSDLHFLDITQYYNTSATANPYKLKVNSKDISQDEIDSADWATIAIMGQIGSAPLLFLHFVDDISGSYLTSAGTVRAIHMLPGCSGLVVTAATANGTIQLDSDLTYMQPTNYVVIPQGQTLFTFSANGTVLFMEPLYINWGTVYTLWIVPTQVKTPAGQVLMTQDWPADVPAA